MPCNNPQVTPRICDSDQTAIAVAYGRPGATPAAVKLLGVSRLVSALSLLAIPACSSESAGGDVGQAEAAIEGGAREYGFVAVGAIVAGGGHCTGTLISPTAVLTAAHCASAEPGSVFYTGTAYVRSPGADDFSSMRAHSIREFRIHPDYKPHRCGEGVDLAIAILERPALGVLPSHLLPEAAPAVGEACISVGFGEHAFDSGVSQSGVKRSDVEHVTSSDFPALHTAYGTGITAPGDSGGALFCKGWQIGVTSCGDSKTSSTYVAIPPQLPWIRANALPHAPL